MLRIATKYIDASIETKKIPILTKKPTIGGKPAIDSKTVLKNKAKILNTNLGEIERVTSLMRVRADEMEILEKISAGDIGAIVSCKNIRSGDTLQ